MGASWAIGARSARPSGWWRRPRRARREHARAYRAWIPEPGHLPWPPAGTSCWAMGSFVLFGEDGGLQVGSPGFEPVEPGVGASVGVGARQRIWWRLGRVGWVGFGVVPAPAVVVAAAQLAVVGRCRSPGGPGLDVITLAAFGGLVAAGVAAVAV